MNDFADHVNKDARLVMLRALHAETDGTHNEILLQKILEAYGHRRSRDYVRTQIRKLEDLGAVSVIEAGTVLVASIRKAGIEHVERRAVIEGIARPSPED